MRTPAQRCCLENVRLHHCGGATRFDVFLRCINNGWVKVKSRTKNVATSYSVLTRKGRLALNEHQARTQEFL